MGILPSVCFLGRVTGVTKTWLLQNARCGCMPSRNWEAFPLVVMEAFAAGKPMIGTRILGLKDLITHGETGWLVASESPAELAAALHEMWVDDGSLLKYAANGAPHGFRAWLAVHRGQASRSIRRSAGPKRRRLAQWIVERRKRLTHDNDLCAVRLSQSVSSTVDFARLLMPIRRGHSR